MSDRDSVFHRLERGERGYPARLLQRLDDQAPPVLIAPGNVELLALSKIALLCSVRCPGNAIIAAHDATRKLREDGTTVISGFQSSVEKECLRILLGGKQPVIICPARALQKIRVPTQWRKALEAGRLLILSPFEKRPRRPTIDSAQQRNRLAAALSDEVLVIHATPGGQIDQLLEVIYGWRIPQKKLIDREFDSADSEDKR